MKATKKLLSILLIIVMTLGLATSAITTTKVKADGEGIAWYISAGQDIPGEKYPMYTLVINPEYGIPTHYTVASGVWTGGAIIPFDLQEQRHLIRNVVADQYTTFPEDCSYAFKGFGILTEFYFDNIDTSNVVSMEGMFQDAANLDTVYLKGIDTSNVENMSGMFLNCENLTGICVEDWEEEVMEDPDFIAGKCDVCIADLRSLNLSKVKYMDSMFGNDSSAESSMWLSKINLKGVDLSSLENMNYFCAGCSGINIFDMDGCKTTNDLKWMQAVLQNNSSLNEVRINGIDTSGVRSMKKIFEGCSNIVSLPTDKLDTSSCEDFTYMFNGCSNLKTLDLTGFETENLERIEGMFADCTSLETIYASDDIYDSFNILDANKDCFVNVNNLSAIGHDGTVCKAGVEGQGRTTENGEFAIIPSSSSPHGYLTSPNYMPEAVILPDSCKSLALNDADAANAAIQSGSLNKLINECADGYYVRLIRDIDLGNPKFDDAELNNEIDSTKITGVPSALDIGGHKLTVNKINLDSDIALMDTSADATGTIVSPKGNVIAEYNSEGAIPLYASDDYSYDGISVSKGYHLLDINFKRACFVFNPNAESLSVVNNAKAGFGTYIKILASQDIVRKKALLILSKEDAISAGLSINFEDLAAVSNEGGVELSNQKDAKKISFHNETTDSVSFRTSESIGALDGEIARSESLKASIKAYAQSCLEDGSTSTFFSARYYLTSRKATTDRYLTYAKYNINVKSIANKNYEIVALKNDDKAL